MRLVDRVLNGPADEELSDSNGRKHIVRGPAAKAEAVRACAVRYALDQEASRQCADLFLKGEALPQLDDPLVRMPATCFWMEIWSSPESEAGRGPPGRMALLAETDETSRRGTITLFSEQSAGDVRLLPGTVEFDLDHPLAKPAGAVNTYRLRHRDLDLVSPILEHTLLHIDEAWIPFARASIDRTYAEFLSFIAESLWFTFPLLVAFSAMLNSGVVLDTRPTDLARLNGARAKRGRRPLLEHIDVSLRLGIRREAGGQRDGGSAKASPRLHFVRGHTVKRASKTFWRSAHFRGDANAPLLTRTVNVSWAAGAVSKAEIGSGTDWHAGGQNWGRQSKS